MMTDDVPAYQLSNLLILLSSNPPPITPRFGYRTYTATLARLTVAHCRQLKTKSCTLPRRRCGNSLK